MNASMIGGIIGFGPALFLIWFSLRKYSYPYVEGSLFEDRKVFFLLAVGMIAGTFIFRFEKALEPLYVIEDGIFFEMFILVFVLAFPLIESLAKFVILNFKGYQGRFDSTFYGLSLGAGYSATAMLGYVIFEVEFQESISPVDWFGIFILSICMVLIHCSVGATLGNATGNKLGLKGLFPAVIPHIVFNMFMLPSLIFDELWYSLILLVPFSVFVFYNVYEHTIPECLPQEVQKEIRRNSRKKLR